MKKLNITLALILSIGAFLGCKKVDQNPEYPFTIIVRTVDDSTRIQNILVEVGVPDKGSKVNMYGYTNERGEIEFTYDQDAVFRVRATRGSNPWTHMGCTHVRLEPNQNVIKEVYLVPYTFPGCSLSFD